MNRTNSQLRIQHDSPYRTSQRQIDASGLTRSRRMSTSEGGWTGGRGRLLKSRNRLALGCITVVHDRSSTLMAIPRHNAAIVRLRARSISFLQPLCIYDIIIMREDDNAKDHAMQTRALPLAPLAQGIAHSIPSISCSPCGTHIESDGILHQFWVTLGKDPRVTRGFSERIIKRYQILDVPIKGL